MGMTITGGMTFAGGMTMLAVATTPNGSVQFNDNLSQYLSVASNAAFGFGTGDFTVECWVYVNASSVGVNIYESRTAQLGNGLNMNISGTPPVPVYRPAGVSQITGSSLNFNTWYHIAYVRSAGVTKMYVNGTQSGLSYTDTQNIATAAIRIGANYNLGGLSDGFISNYRIVKGVAVYTSTFTPPTANLTATQSANVNGNPSAAITGSETSLLLNTNYGAGFLTDTSVNAFTVTNNGAATSSKLNPFNSGTTNYSVVFDGSGDAITFGANSANLAVGAGDFTWEAWVLFNNLPSTEVDIFESQTTGAFRVLKRGTSAGLSLDFYGGTSYLIQADASITDGVWHWVAVSRTSGTISAYYDGTRTLNTAVATTGVAPVAAYSVGGRANGTNSLSGYISNMRLVVGTGLYTGATVSVPTTPATAVSGTQLLICQSATLIDNSSNNYAITAVGNAAVSALTPF
jgi:hypothetical protein